MAIEQEWWEPYVSDHPIVTKTNGKYSISRNGQVCREVEFMRKNFIKCQRCSKATRMSMRICIHCGGDVGISKDTMEALIKHMMYGNITN